ncbi:hypothetical protein L596_024963 [Steinernema carpocapsae]|uniref:Uncharacterized protein n=1 Tax=Steinernema carpocapsae TaxID=34508 RepID=A0A4U5M6F9_STECR|nr:hypothetical protein L596_024963 [Steinernema carpocapsae]
MFSDKSSSLFGLITSNASKSSKTSSNLRITSTSSRRSSQYAISSSFLIASKRWPARMLTAMYSGSVRPE